MSVQWQVQKLNSCLPSLLPYNQKEVYWQHAATCQNKDPTTCARYQETCHIGQEVRFFCKPLCKACPKRNREKGHQELYQGESRDSLERKSSVMHQNFWYQMLQTMFQGEDGDPQSH